MTPIPEIPITAINMSQSASKTLAYVKGHTTELMLIIMGIMLLWLLMRFASHRIVVNKLYMLSGGYTLTTNRYRQTTDRTTSRLKLSPMFGHHELPVYDSKYYQKVEGAPIVGAMRELTLVMLNTHSPLVVDPGTGKIEGIEIKRWTFDTQKAKYIAKRNTMAWVNFLTIYAPVIIIIGAIVFWAVMIYLQMGVTERFAKELQTLIQRF